MPRHRPSKPTRPSAALTPARDLRRFVPLFLAAIVLGLLARLALAFASIGTNDAGWYWQFAHGVREQGLIAWYKADPIFNQPPLPAYWAVTALELSEPAGEAAFPIVFKLPMILADIASAILLYRIFRRRADLPHALLAVAAFAWSLDSILVTGYHCNTDPLYAFLALLAVDLLEHRPRPLAAGLALAAAINIKLIPVLLIPPLLASLLPDRRAALRFLLGLAIGALPFIPPLILGGRAFYQNVIAYNSNIENWGIALLLPDSLLDHYRTLGRHLVLALSIALAFAAWRWRPWNRYQLATVALALFLLFTPGFGVQYTVILLPVLFAADWRFATIYSTLAGVFLAIVYIHFAIPGLPLRSVFTGPYPAHAAFFGLLAWLSLAALLVHIFRKPCPTSARF